MRTDSAYRVDLGMWESRRGQWWHYAVWTPSGTLTMRHRNRRKRGCAKVMRGPDQRLVDAKWPIGRREFETKLKNNKWLVPLNRTLDLSLP